MVLVSGTVYLIS